MTRPRSKSLIFDIYGGYLRQLGGWVAIADLISLMGDLGVDEQAVRSSVSRMSRKGMLARSVRDGHVGYELSTRAVEILEEGDLRIFTGMQPADLADGWVLATFSVPEEHRGRRHQLRSQLVWLGFGSLGGGVWIAPRRVGQQASDALRRLDLERYVDLFEAHYWGPDDLQRLVERCWDLEGLGRLYAGFVEMVGPVLDRWKRRSGRGHDRDAFVDYTTVLHQWRKMPYLDPGLPSQLLPDDWQGTVAADMFTEVVERLDKRAQRYVEGVTARRSRGVSSP